MILDPVLLNQITLIGTGIGAAFVVTLWVSLIFWTIRDIRSRTRDALLRVLAGLVSAILFLPGVLIYLILRPSRTLDQEYQSALEEEALLQTVEEKPTCPGCNRRIKEDWIVCPTCYTRLKKTCHNCGRLMELPWNLCPQCAAPVPGFRLANAEPEPELDQPPTEPEETP